MTSDMVLGLDHDHRCAGFLRDYRRSKARGAGTDHHNIRFDIPTSRNRLGSRRGLCADATQSKGPDPSRPYRDQITTTDRVILF